MQNNKIVLDTNCLLVSISKFGDAYPDDNKFVDCAFAAQATYIVSDDSHFDELREIDFPKLLVLKLKEFMALLEKSN
jgi:predicted nucleic acid-binding protein